jgi:glucose/arabinose dehydrogenase/cytochrome c2
MGDAMRIRDSAGVTVALRLTLWVLGSLVTSHAVAADAAAGLALFRQQCALCHSAQPDDNGGAQGPNLNGVFTRHAASGEAFDYTRALRASNLTFDAATLDRFLSSPTSVVPGSAMVVAVPKQEDRDNLIAYLQAVKEGTIKEAAPRTFGPPPGMRSAATANPPQGDPDWKKDVPGRVHRIDLAKLPKPYDTKSAVNFPKLIERPTDARLQLPAGFKIDVFAANLKGPRAMRVAPNGDIFVSETQGGRVSVLHPSADGSTAATVQTFAQGLQLPFGIAFYPGGEHPQWLYVAENNRIVRYAYSVGDQTARAVPEVVVPELSPVAGGGHFTRDIAFSADGKRMFVSVGSQSNIAETMPKKTPAEIETWEAEHGLGAAWGNETNRADVLVFEVGSSQSSKVFASGIRNCVGLTVQPATGALWCTTNERDMLGDDLVPDYSTRVREGGFYGWPWYYMGKHEDPRLAGQRPDLANKVIVPDVPYQSHSAVLNMVFYTATSGSSAFPKEYVGDGFAVMHGSWNRSFRTGHKIVRVRMKHGVPTGEYDDFLVGFIADDGDAWGRPVGATVASDGSLLMSDDGSNLIYRISYARATSTN